MRRLHLITTLILMVTIAGCATGNTGRTGQRSPSPGHIVPPARGVSGGPPPLPDASPPISPTLTPITPVPGTRERTVRWTSAGQADDGRTLLLDVAIGGPPCDVVTAVDVAESADSVRITVYAGATTPASCTRGIPARIGTVRVRAPLAQPLGLRTLLDGAAK